MTTTVFLVRHGAHDRLGRVLCGRMAGVTLSAAGSAQAAAVAERLAGESLAAVYASPLERAIQTAEPIARRAGLDPITDDDLAELDFGDWTGMRFDDLEGDPAWALWNTARSRARPPGGEAAAEAAARMQRWLSRVCARHPEAAVAGVGHSEPIKALVATVLGLDANAHERFEIGPGSVTVLAAGAWGRKVHTLNEVPA
ncbi:MAG: histidine phosphatase family protein [Phenylobacterium sp.]|uniref:histidine phosphatase family protein n=1 Tax=Phenylobacterium sp. TaxID=1871053 RepID=UPI00391CC353